MGKERETNKREQREGRERIGSRQRYKRRRQRYATHARTHTSLIIRKGEDERELKRSLRYEEQMESGDKGSAGLHAFA